MACFIPLVEDANLLQQVLYHRDTLIDKMPRAGFKSITVSDYVYNRFFGTYERTRRDLELKGITSFSGYLTSMMDEIMTKYETFSRHAPFMEKIDVDQNRITVKDNKRKRIAEVFLKDDKLRCSLDESIDCAHIGFVYSLPEFYNIIAAKGIRISRPSFKQSKIKGNDFI
ncbi:MAG: hypothetical protein WBL49_01910 [Nitrososphaeraceae archaeon]